MHAEGQPQAGLSGKARWTSWGLALVPAAMLFALLARRVWDVDIFWQLKLGELTIRNHGPLHHEPFAALHLQDSLPAVAWLGQVVMASVRLLGGWSLLRLFDALCWLGGFWAAAAACRVRGATLGAVILAIELTFMVALPTASIRPQSFAVLCFGLLLGLQRLELRSLIAILLGAPLLVLWQNLHPSVSVGALAMGAVALPRWLRWLRDRSVAVPIAPTLLAAIGCAAMFATPDGLSIIAISKSNALSSMAIHASEWMPLWIPANRINAIPVLGLALIGLWMTARHRDRVDAGELAVALVLFVLTLNTYRFVLFWAVSMVPVLARAATPRHGAEDVSPLPRGAIVAPVLLVALIGPILLPTRFMPTIPLAAIERLKQEHVRGTVYGDFPFGGAIIDSGYPAWRVAYDGRYYRYSDDEWKYNGGIENGFVPLVDIVRKWHPAAFILDAHHNAPLAGDLARSRKWRRIYARGGIVVYVPNARRSNRP